MAMIVIRLMVFLLSATAVVIAVVPIIVMLDLLSGGTGFGLCSGGIEACDRPYSTGAELIIILTVALFLVVLAIRLLMRLARKMSDDSYQISQS